MSETIEGLKAAIERMGEGPTTTNSSGRLYIFCNIITLHPQVTISRFRAFDTYYNCRRPHVVKTLRTF